MKFELVASLGFLEITKCTDNKRNKVYYTADYCGNMDSTVLTHIKPLFDKIYGEGAFDRTITDSKVSGDPAYTWSMKFSRLPAKSG